jgi:hypothetical protein
MTQTLTTETVKLWRRNAEVTADETDEHDTEHIAAKAILALTAEILANREAQPVEWGSPKTVGQMIGQLQTLDPSMETTALLRMPADILDGNAVRRVPITISFEKLDGQWLAPYKGDGRKVLAFWAKADHREEEERGEPFTAPQSPSYPERLPCPVHLLPGLKLGKGIPTKTLLEALARRAECNKEMEAMTPEERAVHDARVEAFKALLPQPAPEI